MLIYYFFFIVYPNSHTLASIRPQTEEKSLFRLLIKSGSSVNFFSKLRSGLYMKPLLLLQRQRWQVEQQYV